MNESTTDPNCYIEAHIQESKQEEHIEDNMSEQSIVSMWRQFQESVNTY